MNDNLIEQIKQSAHEVSEVMYFGGSDYPVKAIPYAKFLEVLTVFERTHAAEVRAGVVAPEPEWEYEVTYTSMRAPSIDGYRLRASSGMLPSLAAVMQWVGFSINPMVHRRTKAVPAGEWETVPVTQEGAETDA